MNFAEALDNVTKMGVTENGANGYVADKVIEHPLVTAFYGIGSHAEIVSNNPGLIAFQNYIRHHSDMTDIDKMYATRFAFFVRDIMGQGFRDIGRRMLLELALRDMVNPTTLVNFLAVDGYGRWDDVLWIIYNYNVNNPHTKCYRDKLIELVRFQLDRDLILMEHHDEPVSISLLGKWMPSINASSKETRKNAKFWCSVFNWSNEKYRKVLSSLRKQLKIVERNITSNTWENIEYSKVPSLAMNRYKCQFYNHDFDRFESFIEDVVNGKAKINTKTLTAPEIIHNYNIEYCSKEDAASEALWNKLNHIKFNRPIIPVCDVSGSMYRSISGRSLTALDVSVGLSIYMAECNTGVYHNKVIEFSCDSRCIDIGDGSLLDKFKKINTNIGYNTNVEGVLDQIYKLGQMSDDKDNIPTLVFFSDMEFDEARDADDDQPFQTVFEQYSNKFKEAGLKFPKIVFWNINSHSNVIQMKTNESGLIECSGFSQNVLDIIIGDDYDSWSALKRVLDYDRYAKIY